MKTMARKVRLRFVAAWCMAFVVGVVAAEPLTVDLDGLKRNAEAGDRVAQYNFGVIQETGRFGVPMDKAKAAAWYRKSADQGYANAQYNLGVLYLHGQGVKLDREAALRWLRMAAGQNHQPAMAALQKLGVAGPKPSTAGN